MHRFFEVLHGLAQADSARARNWNDRTREEKRLTAPYALGWEEGYEAAYRQFTERGEVSAPGVQWKKLGEA